MSDAFVAMQRLLPKQTLTRWVGRLGKSTSPLIRRTFIHNFARIYGITLEEAEFDRLDDYPSFNDFFTRGLKPDARPIDHRADSFVSPADGVISQAGTIEAGQLLQAKGHRYGIDALAGASVAERFDDGQFITVYLAPHNYHRVHLPVVGTLTQSTALPGKLFSVNGKTENAIEGLFCVNERLVTHFATAAGEVLVVLVGALIVASIETVWRGPNSPYRQIVHTQHNETFTKGAEIGRFLLGSTVIVCFQPGRATFHPDVQRGRNVQVGEALGQLQL